MLTGGPADVSYALPLLARLLSFCTAEPVWRIDGQYSLGRLSVPLNATGLFFLTFCSMLHTPNCLVCQQCADHLI